MTENIALQKVESTFHACTKCELSAQRNKVVFYRGVENPDVILIGEAPGAEEDKDGKPFVGRSGKLLDIAIEHLELSSVAIINTVGCRPPKNRAPKKPEVEACLVRTEELITALSKNEDVPIIALGGTAKKWCEKYAGGKKWHSIWHPAYVLYAGGEKGKRFAPWIEQWREALTQ